MPQNQPYPGETPEQFRRRQLQQQPTTVQGYPLNPRPLGIEPEFVLGTMGSAAVGGLQSLGETLDPTPPVLPRPPGVPAAFSEATAPPSLPSPNMPSPRISRAASYAPEDYKISGIEYGGPSLGNEAALAGLAGAPEHPLLQLIKLGSEFRTGQRPDSPSYQRGQDISGYVGEQLAPQRQQLSGVESAITAMHPAVQAVQEAEAQRKAYPLAAQAAGFAEQAEIGAEADIQQAMIEAAQGNVESLRELLPPALKGLVDIAGGPDPDSPQAKDAWDLIWSFVTQLGQQGAI